MIFSFFSSSLFLRFLLPACILWISKIILKNTIQKLNKYL